MGEFAGSSPSGNLVGILSVLVGVWWEFSGNSTGRARKVGILWFLVGVRGSLVGKEGI